MNFYEYEYDEPWTESHSKQFLKIEFEHFPIFYCLDVGVYFRKSSHSMEHTTQKTSNDEREDL